tara:strand:+ start:28 stop:747 length:720 start_codon:yes stop_codon:yes gene_type:complete
MSKSTLLGIALNVIFVLSIFTIRYYYAKQEYDFLVKDSERQEKLIQENKETIDSLTSVVRRLQIDNDTQDTEISKIKTEYYERIRWEKEYEQRVQNLIDSLNTMKLDVYDVRSAIVPFEREFGSQDNYIRLFGRSGLRIKNNTIVDSGTDVDFDGSISLGTPIIENVGKYEFRAINPDRQFYGVTLKGGVSDTYKVRPPRNQISVGPMLGITYNSETGLTEPIWGFGVTYNLFKIWDWK